MFFETSEKQNLNAKIAHFTAITVAAGYFGHFVFAEFSVKLILRVVNEF